MTKVLPLQEMCAQCTHNCGRRSLPGEQGDETHFGCSSIGAKPREGARRRMSSLVMDREEKRSVKGRKGRQLLFRACLDVHERKVHGQSTALKGDCLCKTRLRGGRVFVRERPSPFGQVSQQRTRTRVGGSMALLPSWPSFIQVDVLNASAGAWELG